MFVIIGFFVITLINSNEVIIMASAFHPVKEVPIAVFDALRRSPVDAIQDAYIAELRQLAESGVIYLNDERSENPPSVKKLLEGCFGVSPDKFFLYPLKRMDTTFNHIFQAIDRDCAFERRVEVFFEKDRALQQLLLATENAILVANFEDVFFGCIEDLHKEIFGKTSHYNGLGQFLMELRYRLAQKRTLSSYLSFDEIIEKEQQKEKDQRIVKATKMILRDKTVVFRYLYKPYDLRYRSFTPVTPTMLSSTPETPPIPSTSKRSISAMLERLLSPPPGFLKGQ